MKPNSAAQQVQALKNNGARVQFFYERFAELKDPAFRVLEPATSYSESFGLVCSVATNINASIVSSSLFSVKGLKEAGYSAYRNGGRVTARITTASGEEVVAIAECSIQDEFSKEKGRRIALGRAIKELSKDLSTQ